MLHTGNLFELATKKLINEIDAGTREKFTGLDILNYAIKERKWLDKYCKKGLNTERIIGKKEYRRIKYIRNEK